MCLFVGSRLYTVGEESCCGSQVIERTRMETKYKHSICCGGRFYGPKDDFNGTPTETTLLTNMPFL